MSAGLRATNGGSAQGRRAAAAVWLLRGIRLSPAFTRGIVLTLACALVATVGRIVVPIAIQRVVDLGVKGNDGVELSRVRTTVAMAAVGVLVTALAAYLLRVRLFRSTELGLADIRVQAFRHIHDLSMLTQNTERRGSYVSRVTGDVDSVSGFMEAGGMVLIVSAGQIAVATVLMLVYSWQLTLLVWVCFLPLVILLRVSQRSISAGFVGVRERVADVLGAVSESVVGVATIRAYAVEDRTSRRLDATIDRHLQAITRVAKVISLLSIPTEFVAGLATALVVVAGVLLGVDGDLTAGQLLAFLFLVTLFVRPMQVGSEQVSEAQNAAAGFRRVLGVLDLVPDVADPGEWGVELPRGPVEVRFEGVGFSYPGGPPVLHDVEAEIPAGSRVAVVGETGSGKTTFAKLLARLMDPVSGRVLVDGVDLREVRFSSLRSRIVMVPQDGFLFDASLADNIRLGRPEASDRDVEVALGELGLADWLGGMPGGLGTACGERGEFLSAGERQLVALARAYLADPDLLLLDEATSAVDPGTEVRIARALDGLTRGRTSVTIAHRLSTAEAADEVLVFDAGRIVQQGSHAELVGRDGVYARMHASWAAQLGAAR